MLVAAVIVEDGALLEDPDWLLFIRLGLDGCVFTCLHWDRRRELWESEGARVSLDRLFGASLHRKLDRLLGGFGVAVLGSTHRQQSEEDHLV